jgi:hypothetical protein
MPGTFLQACHGNLPRIAAARCGSAGVDPVDVALAGDAHADVGSADPDGQDQAHADDAEPGDGWERLGLDQVPVDQ